MSSSAPASRGVNRSIGRCRFNSFWRRGQPSATELVSGIKQFINTFVDDDDDDVDDDDVVENRKRRKRRREE